MNATAYVCYIVYVIYAYIYIGDIFVKSIVRVAHSHKSIPRNSFQDAIPDFQLIPRGNEARRDEK